MRALPHAPEAEEAVLGAILLRDDLYEPVTKVLGTPSKQDSPFLSERPRRVWAAMGKAHQEHGRVDAVIVQKIFRDQGSAKMGEYLVHLTSSCAAPSAAVRHAEIVRDCSVRRYALRELQEVQNSIYEGNGFRAKLERVFETVNVAAEGETPVGLMDLWDLSDTDDPEYDWLIEGLIEREGRVILFGEEGGGKSLFTLQLIVQAAAGLPVLGRFKTPRPLNVLYVDLEMPQRAVRRRARMFRIQAEKQVGELHSVPFMSRPEGLDLTTSVGRGQLERALTSTRPDLVVIDPLYKLCPGDMLKDSEIKPFTSYLDYIRTEFKCGIWIVHHPRKAPDSHHQRGSVSSDMFGGSLLLRWPELILVLMEDRFRVHKPRDDYFQKNQEVPLKKGGEWVFTALGGAVWTDEHREVEDLISGSDEPLGVKEIGRSLGISTAVVREVLKQLVANGRAIRHRPERGGHPLFSGASGTKGSEWHDS